MQINQISQLLQPQVSQTKAGVDNSSSNKVFELMLQEMMQSTGSQDASSTLGLNSNNSVNSTNLINGINGITSTSNVNTTDKTGVQNKTASGIDSLSVNPQKMAQMLEIIRMSDANSALTNIGSDDSSGDDSGSDSSSAGLDSIKSSNSMGRGIAQLLQTILQNQASSSSNTENANNLNTQI